jgi:hypothetical protein
MTGHVFQHSSGFTQLWHSMTKDRRFVGLSAEGRWLFMDLLIYCNKEASDGVIPAREVARCSDYPDALDEVLDSGLVEADGDELWVPDYLADSPGYGYRAESYRSGERAKTAAQKKRQRERDPEKAKADARKYKAAQRAREKANVSPAGTDMSVHPPRGIDYKKGGSAHFGGGGAPPHAASPPALPESEWKALLDVWYQAVLTANGEAAYEARQGLGDDWSHEDLMKLGALRAAGGPFPAESTHQPRDETLEQWEETWTGWEEPVVEKARIRGPQPITEEGRREAGLLT